MSADSCPSCDVPYEDSTKVPWLPKWKQEVRYGEETSWDERDRETFVFLTLRFDVDLAKRILGERPHPIQMVEAQKLERFYSEREGKGLSIFESGVSPNLDLSHANISIPTIWVHLPKGAGDGGEAGMMVDGIHRLNRRHECGCATAPAVVLTPEESALCAVRLSDPAAFKSSFGISKAEALRRAKAEGLPVEDAQMRRRR